MKNKFCYLSPLIIRNCSSKCCCWNCCWWCFDIADIASKLSTAAFLRKKFFKDLLLKSAKNFADFFCPQKTCGLFVKSAKNLRTKIFFGENLRTKRGARKLRKTHHLPFHLLVMMKTSSSPTISIFNSSSKQSIKRRSHLLLSCCSYSNCWGWRGRI